ncbi:hypothetical protein B0T11DRAFT_322822 [Plectosphaerella cucumerina]|uniref:NAD-dependent epimerase/dehydratase domain-containing protein n=1 Tax=Plectosphaerella cucumerina TaxID=40658 RepID=A0A8K0X989_9PEZI|nr:hypothetical protein B0T11DRAFT_322822 [Plectosphaerella cucumerina]
MARQNVLVTGSNGYIGAAVCRAFNRAGWRVFGLVRRPEAAIEVSAVEVTPILGDLDLDVVSTFGKYTDTVDVIVSATEVLPGYAEHYEKAMTLIRALTKKSNDNGVRPLVLWTSGCKDYGITDVDGAQGLAPHTEDSPVAPWLDFLVPRATSCMRVFDNTDTFDAALLRPTNVYGLGSSHYARWFETAAEVKKTGQKLALTVDSKTIVHGMHVDDCGEAYVALAEHPDRGKVGGQAFNISAHSFETTGQVWAALQHVYGIDGQVEFVQPEDAKEQTPQTLAWIFGYSQWVSSEKIRDLTGWSDKRMLFGEGISVYRRAYETWAATPEAGAVRQAEMVKQVLNK